MLYCCGVGGRLESARGGFLPVEWSTQTLPAFNFLCSWKNSKFVLVAWMGSRTSDFAPLTNPAAQLAQKYYTNINVLSISIWYFGTHTRYQNKHV